MLSLRTATDLAAESQLPLPTVSKLLKELLQSGLLVSQRGIKGGYMLARAAREISVDRDHRGARRARGAHRVQHARFGARATCDLEPSCPIMRNQQIINQVVRGVLERITLSDLLQPMQLTSIKDARGNALPPSARIRENSMSSNTDAIRDFAQQEYKWGFITDIEEERIPKGLSEDVIRLISAKKKEPEFMLEWRLKAYRHWASLEQAQAEPKWANVKFPPIDYQDITYYSAPKQKPILKSLDRARPGNSEHVRKAGHPARRSRSCSRAWPWTRCLTASPWRTTFKAKLAEAGVIFCSFSEAVQEHPELVKKYLGSVVPYTDNFFAALNAAVFTRRLVCVTCPKGVRCPMELSTYFRINAAETGQFERTLIVADEGAYVSYLEGCTAPIRDENQLHAAVVELVALDNAQIKYSTVQNWYPGDKEGKGGIYNFVTKRGKCLGKNSKISWTQVETGSAITWKYPSCILQGDNSVGEFYSVALTNNYQQADTGTKMIHIGKNTQQHDRLEGHFRRARAEHLSRPGEDPEGRYRRAQLHAVRFAADRRQVRRAHVPVYRGEKLHGAHGARSVHLENRRRPAFLSAPARAEGRRRRLHDRERLLQARLPRTADGIRRRGAETAERQPGRQRRLSAGASMHLVDIHDGRLMNRTIRKSRRKNE